MWPSEDIGKSSSTIPSKPLTSSSLVSIAIVTMATTSPSHALVDYSADHFQCEICGRTSTSRSDLARHMKIHAPNRDELMHRCAYQGCTFAAVQRSNVVSHYIALHTTLRPYTCPEVIEVQPGVAAQCPFTTGHPSSLTKHRRNLHNYKPGSTTYNNLALLPDIPYDQMVLPPLATIARFEEKLASRRSTEASGVPVGIPRPEPPSRWTATPSSSGPVLQVPNRLGSGKEDHEAHAAMLFEQRRPAVASHPYVTARKTSHPTPSASSSNTMRAEKRVEEVARTRSTRSGYNPTNNLHRRAAPSVRVSLAQFNTLPPRMTAPRC
ncbi:hypothetical protein C8Q73DRAFT_93444 [Cubamyces lactineus]|nr:hypothetical protein C8Q73DRAFT_93444 [Cubamyces lactineus]